MRTPGRPKKFDPEQKLIQAMELFWEKGYENTSLSDLLDHLQISRQSLYDTYGDKSTLFQKSLEQYEKQTVLMLHSTLNAPDASLKTIKEIFEKYLEVTALDPINKSCLMANTAMELALHNPRIQSVTYNFFQLLIKAFENALKNAIKNEELTSDKNPKILANFIISNMMGISIMSKGGIPQETIKDIFSLVFSVLES